MPVAGTVTINPGPQGVATGAPEGTQFCPATDSSGNPYKASFFGAATVAQPTASGNTHTVTAGSTTTVFTNTTFDGSTGTTAYTVGDIVKALKALGLIAS